MMIDSDDIWTVVLFVATVVLAGLFLRELTK